jgi:hypothetical protein
MDWLIWPIVVVAAAILLALWLWWFFQRPKRHLSAFQTSASPGREGYSIWCFQGGRWSLVEDRSAPGFVPGPPPVEPGQFDGYCVRVASVRSAEPR